MSVQIFLQGRIIGIEHFLLAASSDLDGRAHWVSLVSEVLPRALLAELGLSKMLLGSSGGEQFLVVLPAEFRTQAEDFLTTASRHMAELSGGQVKLLWAMTENLGDWTVVRKRLSEEMTAKLGAPAADQASDCFVPFPAPEQTEASAYFASDLGRELRDTKSVGWSPETPGQVLPGRGKHEWSLSGTLDGISYARHTALSDDEATPATLHDLAQRASGRKTWGVLRGDVDNAGVRLRRAQTIEEHIQLSVMYKQFFAGELELLCSLPEFWRKVTLLYSGADDFAVYGSWDALLALAREVQRLFHRFTVEFLKDLPGPEGKTLTMAFAIAEEDDVSLGTIFEEAGRNLETAKASGKDCIYLMGRTLEWKQLADSADTKDTISRMVSEFGCSPQLLYELASFYRESAARDGQAPAGGRQRRNDRVERPWRFHRRLNMVTGAVSLSSGRNKEFQKLRAALISDFTGRNAAHIRLRPQGRVALEWARLETGV